MTSPKDEHRIRMDTVAAILHDEAHLFGKRVALAWPDGLPDDPALTEDEVRRIVDTMAGRTTSRP